MSLSDPCYSRPSGRPVTVRQDDIHRLRCPRCCGGCRMVTSMALDGSLATGTLEVCRWCMGLIRVPDVGSHEVSADVWAEPVDWVIASTQATAVQRYLRDAVLLGELYRSDHFPAEARSAAW
jgi:hypothetical protein